MKNVLVFKRKPVADETISERKNIVCIRFPLNRRKDKHDNSVNCHDDYLPAA